MANSHHLLWRQYPRLVAMLLTDYDSRMARSETVSSMRNLGPVVEKDLKAVGITTAAQVRRLGPKNAFVRMLDGRLRSGRSAACCNAAYLYSLYGAIHDVDWRDIPEQKKREFKKFTAELRASGKYREKP